jgi:hypothetical protein
VPCIANLQEAINYLQPAAAVAAAAATANTRESWSPFDGYQQGGGLGFLFVHKQQRWNKTATVTLRVGSEGRGPGGGGKEGRKEGMNELGLFAFFLFVFFWFGDFSFLFFFVARATTTVLSQGYIVESSTFTHVVSRSYFLLNT